MFYTRIVSSPIGDLCICSDGENLSGLWMVGQKYFQANVKDEELIQLSDASGDISRDAAGAVSEASIGAATQASDYTMPDDLPIFAQVSKWLSDYFEGNDPGPLPPIKTEGGEFRQLVWKHLREIPYGQLTTYGEIARKVAVETGKEKMSAQAVGNAVGHNPISIIVPCHRVVGSNRSLTGYAGGLDIKRFLLTLEGVDVSSLKTPTKGTAL